jgi:hypothetical protein
MQEKNIPDKIQNLLEKSIKSVNCQLVDKKKKSYQTEPMSKQYFYFAYQPLKIGYQLITIRWQLVGGEQLVCPPYPHDVG